MLDVGERNPVFQGIDSKYREMSEHGRNTRGRVKVSRVFRTGLVSVTFRNLAPEAIVAAAQEASLEGIEWGGDVHVPPEDVEQAERVTEMTKAAGLEIPSYGSYFRLAEQPVETFEPVLRTATILGAPNIRVWAGRLGSAQADATYHERARSDARRIAEMAAEAGITLSYEYHRNTLADSHEATLQLLNDVGRADVHTYWQPETDRSLEENKEALTALLPHLSHIHVFHWVGNERRALAEGADVWNEYFQTIRSTGRQHWALLEFVANDSLDSFRQDAATLNRLVQSA